MATLEQVAQELLEEKVENQADVAGVEIEEESIAKLLSKHLESDNPNIVAAALEKLRDLCRLDNAKKNSKEVFQLGGHTFILSAMRRHSTSSGVQSEGCRAIANISVHNDAVDGPIGKMGGIKVILGELKKFPSDQTIQDNGLFALENLSCGCVQNKHAIVELEGIPIVIKAMQKFPLETGVQCCGCCLFAGAAAPLLHCKPYTAP